MFVQLIVGRVADAAGLRHQWEGWHRELAPGAAGWLGSTGGITTDGRFVLAVRFTSQEAARSGSGRSERAAWWSRTRACLHGTEVFLETTDVNVVHEDDPDAAGFVQVMRAHVRDRRRLEAIEAEIGPAFRELRPDLLGAYRAWFPDGTLAAVDYFRSEAEARAGEAKEMPDALRAGFGEWMSLLEGTEWHDLVDPWLAAPPLTRRR